MMMRGGPQQFPVAPPPNHGFPVMVPGGGGYGGMHQQPMMGASSMPYGMQPGIPPQFIMQPAVYQMPPNVTGQPGFIPPAYGDIGNHYFQPVHGSGVHGARPPSTDRYHQQHQQQQQQQHQLAEAMKQRQFAEQQRRLQEFGTIGSRKMDADSLIETILGKTGGSRHDVQASKSGTSNLVTPGAIKPVTTCATSTENHCSQAAEVDDGFGDFLSGVPNHAMSSTSSSLSGTNPAGSGLAAASGAAGPVGPDLSAATANTVAASSVALSSSSSISAASPASGERKKDLMSMMMNSCDLSSAASKNAKSFAKKPTVKDIHVAKPTTGVTYNDSRAARTWTSDQTNNLSELFTLPAPVVPAVADAGTRRPRYSSGSSTDSIPSFPLPRWVTGDLPAPDVYHHVLQAATGTDGRIEIEAVYRILLRSNLPREVLGYIWELCNKSTPGQLIREELFLMLAMISVAQNNLNYSSLSILSRCPQAPVPNLGQFDQPIAVSAPVSGLVTGVPAPISPGAASTEPLHSLPVVQAPEYPPYHRVEAIPVPAGGEPGGIRGLPAPFQPPPGMHASMQYSGISAANSGTAATPADDDDFTDFLAAPHGPSAATVHGAPPALSLHNTSAAGNFAMSAHSMPGSLQPSAGTTEQNLMQSTEDDKYAIFRMLAENNTEPQAAAAKPEVHSTDWQSSAADNNHTAEFTDFESFQTASLTSPTASSTAINLAPSLTPSQPLAFAAAAAGVQPTSLPSISGSQSSLSRLSDSTTSATDRYQLIKSLVSDPSLFKPIPVVTETQPFESKLPQNDDGLPAAVDEWAEFQGLPRTPVAASIEDTIQPPKLQAPGAQIPSLFPPADDEWADFQSTDNKPTTAFSNDAHAVDTLNFPQSPTIKSDTKNATFNQPTVGVKTAQRVDWLDETKAAGYFGSQPASARPSAVFGIKGSTASFSSAALDLSPPDFPPENDEDDAVDDFGFYKSSVGGQGISSLSAVDLDEDLVDVLKPKNSPRDAVQKGLSAGGLEFGGWKGLKSVRKYDDDQLSGFGGYDGSNIVNSEWTDSGTVSRDDSPARTVPADADNQSESSLEFAAVPAGMIGNIVGSGGNDNEIRSVKSLELKTTVSSPDDELTMSGALASEHSSPRQFVPSSEVPDYTGWGLTPKRKPSSGPVNIKDLLDEGSLGMFGDRYSHLMQELQASERHAYEWERCLEQCRHLLSQAEEIFGSVSSSAVCREVASVEQGAAFLSGLTEVYLVARRIVTEMKTVSISNARLALLAKDIETTWNSIAGIFASNPQMTSSISLDLSRGILRADDDGSRQRTCGLCLFDVDWSPASLDLSSSDTAWPKLSYGGRQYHAACANFWINFVDLTLPSLTIPELL